MNIWLSLFALLFAILLWGNKFIFSITVFIFIVLTSVMIGCHIPQYLKLWVYCCCFVLQSNLVSGKEHLQNSKRFSSEDNCLAPIGERLGKIIDQQVNEMDVNAFAISMHTCPHASR